MSERINGYTNIYGLLGYPARHSFSPLIHNFLFEKNSINSVYLVFEIKPEKGEYTIESMGGGQHLAEGSPVRKLYEALRKEVLAIDPVVVEEVKKLYIAYKAETNFVDVVPQAKALRMALNIDFNEINDPKGMCKDVAGIGRWGNGDAEVKLSSLDQLPYVIGLVRQAFEKQMGNGE